MFAIRPLHFGDIFSATHRGNYKQHDSISKEVIGSEDLSLKLAFSDEAFGIVRYLLVDVNGIKAKAGMIYTDDDAHDLPRIIAPENQPSVWGTCFRYLSKHPDITLPQNPKSYQVREVNRDTFEKALSGNT